MTPNAPFPLPVVGDAPPPVVPSRAPYSTDYWRSLDEKLRGGHQSAGEFPDGSTTLDPVARRDFVKLLGASLALAGVGSACTAPRDVKMVPYHKNPDGLTIGNALHYASAFAFGGVGAGVLVTAREGRPVKVDGNPEHALSLGASGSLEQALLIQLYDPQRARLPKHGGRTFARKAMVDVITARVDEAAKRDGGARVRFLTEPTGAPLLAALTEEVKAKLPAAKFIATTPLPQQARHEGARLAFGTPLQALPDYSKAKVVLSLDEDFLFAWGQNLAAAAQWARAREPGRAMSRVYVVEPSMTVTGTVADHRLRLRGSQVEGFARALAVKLGGALAGTTGASLEPGHEKFLEALAEDLKAAGAGALIVAGERQGAAVHALAYAMNALLGSVGTTLTFVPPPVDDIATGPAALKALLDELKAGAVDTLVITAKNPAQLRWADLDLLAAMAKATTFTLGLYEDETAVASTYFLNAAHPLEAWGDAKALDGSILMQQPLIEPLYHGASEAQFLAMWAGRGDVKGLELLRASWVKRSAVTDADWAKWLQLGFIPDSRDAAVEVVCDYAAVTLARAGAPVAGLELALVRDYKVHDGSVGNLAWLQELPDPVTKLVWDNAALISPRTAQALGLALPSKWSAPAREVKLLKLVVRGVSVDAPVFILPGHVDGAVTLALGYGRTAEAEQVARGVGADGYSLRFSDAPCFMPVTLAVANATHPLTTTQEHWDMEQRRIALEFPLEGFEAGAVKKELGALRLELGKTSGDSATKQLTVQAPVDYERFEYKWALSIDLNRCTGCSACVTACQAENNIPVVGRESVARNREMFWMRIDRYFGGDLHEPTVISQPVTCQHCETAPCEYVCPVNATVHSDEGLNDMVYNRCIGTRYCSNNCPYKVRRFNYFHYTGDKTPVERLAMNPEVTVRSRGVMEKCTFCIQRIEKARIETRREGRKMKDGDVVTACQQACPTQAIIFGDLHDAQAKVSKAWADGRAYNLLQQLGTRPRTRYLARIRNPNPKLAGPSSKEQHG